jgi:hypothetical protein
MVYTSLQNYINTVGGEHGIQTPKVVVVVWWWWWSLLLLFGHTSVHPSLFLGEWSVPMYLNANYI